MNRRSLVRGLAHWGATAVLASSTLLAHAGGYPDHPVMVILPFPAGTVTDTVTRIVTERLSQRLNQPFIVENRPGGNGSIGASHAARSTPDGYTLLLGTNTTHSIISSLLKKVPYDPQKDFTPVAKLARLPPMIITGPSLPVTSLRELVQHARAHPGKVRYGFGNSSGQIGGESLKRAGGDMIAVPYKGNPKGLQDLLGGHIEAMVIDITTGLGAVKSGKVRALAVLTDKRMAILPDVPTMNEVLGPGNDNAAWLGVFGPANLPRDVVEVLARELKAVMDEPAVIERLHALGVITGYLPPADFMPFLAREQVRWTKLASEAGISPE